MSIACNHLVPSPNPLRNMPGELPLTGHETLDHFVHIIKMQDVRRAKRERLPELAPCETDKLLLPRLKRVVKALF